MRKPTFYGWCYNPKRVQFYIFQKNYENGFNAVMESKIFNYYKVLWEQLFLKLRISPQFLNRKNELIIISEILNGSFDLLTNSNFFFFILVV